MAALDEHECGHSHDPCQLRRELSPYILYFREELTNELSQKRDFLLNISQE